MAKKGQTPEQQVKGLCAELREELGHWNHLKEYGGQDPFWEDGANMNLVRNHIIYGKRRIEEICVESGLPFPEEMNLEIPTEVDDYYMARADEIRRSAREALKRYLNNPDYIWLLRHKPGEKEARETSYGNVMGYVNGLREAIQKDRLIDMRRHEKTDLYEDSFRSCRKALEEIRKEKAGNPQEFQYEQMSLADYLDGGLIG